jgi:DNA invertase Pin-like site-specific DNA recombinase
MSDSSKITDAHRRRRAVVYVRQSTPQQLERNHESRARQYALRERAIELGWPLAAVSVVDEDLGRSGASAEGRFGFKELVAEVGLGHVGLVLALEVSRLARSSADWHQLLDLCALTGTLIADQDGIYSPQEFNDRLLLGLKGTMSEAELHLNAPRRRAAQQGRARRARPRAAGGARPRRGGPDRALGGRAGAPRDRPRVLALAAVFSLWRRLGSARQVVAELVVEGQLLPRRTVGQRRVRWKRANYAAVHDFLTNPTYAGAFFGRTRQHKSLGPDGRVRLKVVELPLEEWSVCIPDHHPGYVSWHEYLKTRERLRQNVRPRGGAAARRARAERCSRGSCAVAAAGGGCRSPIQAATATSPAMPASGTATCTRARPASRSAACGSSARSPRPSWRR